MSFDRLIENIVRTQNPSVVGLDPRLEYVPEYIVEKKLKKYGKTLKAASKANVRLGGRQDPHQDH